MSSRSLCFVEAPLFLLLFDSPHCLAPLYQLSYALQHHTQDRKRAPGCQLEAQNFLFLICPHSHQMVPFHYFIFCSVFCDSPIIHIFSYKYFPPSLTVMCSLFSSIIILSWREQERTSNTAPVREWVRKKLPDILFLRGKRGDQEHMVDCPAYSAWTR